MRTTEQAFGEKLHTYTIVDAIADKNVLPFKIDYISTFREAENIEDEKVADIDRKRVLADPQRISKIVHYIRGHFDQKTKRNSTYMLQERRLAGFNSIFAVSSIDMAKRYYLEFQKQLQDLPSDQQLKIATIFSYAANEEQPDGTIDENPEDTLGLDQTSKDFLQQAIADYNKLFSTSFDTSADKFQNYYKDVSQRVKNREIDILIVVNMFLTGFDATTLNTLRVDKNLQSHGLIQAFSRTNRILNSVKTFGNIVCFRNLEQRTNDAISLFGDKEAGGIVLLKTFDEYYHGYTRADEEVKGYQELVQQLKEQYPISERISSEKAQKDFIKLYSSILKLHNILSSFDQFQETSDLTKGEMQDYHSKYIDLYNEFRANKDQDEKQVINDDLVFEMELIKQIQINIDYILDQIRKYHDQHINDKEILADINRSIESSFELRNKKDLIEQFIQNLDSSMQVDQEWIAFVQKKKTEELQKIITEEKLNTDQTYKFVRNAFRDGEISMT